MIVGSVLYGETDRIKAFIEKIMPGGGDVQGHGLGVMKHGELIAGFLFHSFREHDGRLVDCELTVAAQSAGWAFPSVIRRLKAYPRQVGSPRVTARVAADNHICRRIVEGAGFKVEGVQRRAYDGATDLILYGLMIEDDR